MDTLPCCRLEEHRRAAAMRARMLPSLVGEAAEVEAPEKGLVLCGHGRGLDDDLNRCPYGHHRPQHRAFHRAANDRGVLLPEGAARAVRSPLCLGDATLPRHSAHT